MTLCHCAQDRCKGQSSRPPTPLKSAALLTTLGLLRRSRAAGGLQRGCGCWAQWGPPFPEVALPPPPNGRAGARAYARTWNPERCSLPARVAAGTSQSRGHHRRWRLQHLHRPPQLPTKEHTGGGGAAATSQLPASRKSLLSQHGGDRWERAGARRVGAGREK